MSFDAYNFGCRTTPDQTYDFDAGGEIEYLGVKMQRKQGLDFTCLTDHAEYLGVNQLLIDTTNPLSKSPIGMLVNSGNKDSAFKAYSDDGSIHGKRRTHWISGGSQSNSSKLEI